MSQPSEVMKYTTTHEWVRLGADGIAAVGITAFAQAALGPIQSVELPQVGARFRQGEPCSIVETAKVAADICMPVTGEIVAINDSLTGAWKQINEDPFGAWLFQVRVANSAEFAALLDEAAYRSTTSAS